MCVVKAEICPQICINILRFLKKVYNSTMNTALKARLITFLLSYFLGCILTGEIVSRAVAHKPAGELGGSGNPGMANITSALGLKAGLTVLAGDLLKCALAMGISWYLFKDRGRIILYYAGLGASFGHSMPFWRHFSGGKAVATSGLTLFAYSPLWGLLSLLAGLAVALISGWLSLAGVAIPFCFLFPAWFVYGKEAFLLTVILFFLCFFRHYPNGKNFPAGAGKKMHLAADLMNKLRK